MKFICSQPDLSRALGIVGRAIKPNATLPILENILIKAHGKKVYLTSTNLEITIECIAEARVVNEGSTTIPAKLLDAYVGLLPKSEQIEVALLNTFDIEIHTPSSETIIKGLNPDDFPTTPSVEHQGGVTIAPSDIQDAVTKTIYAVSTSPSRPILTGIHIQIKGDQLIFVGTNSYRLAEKVVQVKKVNSSIEECNIPYQTMAEVARVFTNTDEDIEMTLSKNQIQFSQDGIRLVSRLIEGKFPDYRQIIPQSTVSRAILSTADLLMAIKRMSLFARENNNTIKFEFITDGQSKVVLTSNTTELGSGRTELICAIEGDGTSISLNSTYLIDFLSTTPGEYVYFDVDTSVAPAVLRPKEKNDYMYLVMSVKGE